MQIKLLFAVVFTAVLGFVSCSEYVEVGRDPDNNTGEPTYASFCFKSRSSDSRATDLKADPSELAVSSVRLFIFSGGILETLVTPKFSETVTDPVEITTGMKTIYLVAPADTKFEEGFVPQVGSTSLVDFERVLTSASKNVIAEENAFLMAGGKTVAITKCSKEEARNNPTLITITRSAAKVQLSVSVDADIRASINAGFDDFSFGLSQTPKNMFLLPGDDHFTSLGDRNESCYSNFEPIPEDFTGYFVDAVDEFCSDTSKSRYCGENFQKNVPVAGSATFALIQCKTTPLNIYKNNILSDGTFFVIAYNNPVSASWVFLHDDNHKQLYFASRQDALDYIDEKEMNKNLNDGDPEWEVFEYKNGLCFYRVNLTTEQDENLPKNLRYCVRRNTFYRILVSKIEALGAPYAKGVVPEDPDQPVEASTWLVCDIDVEPWVVCDMNDQVLQ